MTNEHILKRLAEIEGIKFSEGLPMSCGKFPIRDKNDNGVFWNPLIDWKDLGPLIYKHAIDINQDSSGSGYALIYVEGTDACFEFDFDSESGLKLAACLAIIKKHEV